MRFDVASLRKIAGDKVFSRAQAYFQGGRVEILFVGPDGVRARVAGREYYRTVIKGRDKAIAGECSCPAYEDWGICKHVVATALAVNAGEGVAKELAAAQARIRSHLKSQSTDALVDMILEYAEMDPELFSRLDPEFRQLTTKSAELSWKAETSVRLQMVSVREEGRPAGV